MASSTTTITETSNSSLTLTSPPSTPTEEQQERQEEEDIYDEIELEDMTYDATLRIYHYPCPCGDRFEISIQTLRDGDSDVAVCPSCELRIRVIFDVEDLAEPS